MSTTSTTKSGFSFLPPLAVTAAGVVLMGIILAPERSWSNLLLMSVYIIGIALAAMMFLSLTYVTSAGWSVILKRVAESVASTLPLGAGLILLTLAGVGVLYEWSHAEHVAADPLLLAKSGWLNVSFFVSRTVFYVVVWLLFMQAMLRISKGQDAAPGMAANRKSVIVSACFIASFMVTFSLATFDWLMSLQPHWFSTMFAVYNFAGAFTSGLAVIMLLAIILRQPGRPLAGLISEEHLHDLAKLIIAFSTFWMYVWYSQYMLIWYSNLPEEVTFFVHRHAGAWAVLSIVNLLANWIIPFLVLLPRGSKRNEGILIKVCVLLLIGRWIDLYVMIQPVFEPESPRFGLWEIAPVVVAVALFIMLLRRNLSRTKLVPEGDPYLEESLRH
jgi:hypothetical protein